MIDQQLIPHRFTIRDLANHLETAEAIRSMVVRGAGAIGASAGYGMAQVVLEAPDGLDFMAYIEQGSATLRHTRPTAQDLFYAIERVLRLRCGAAALRIHASWLSRLLRRLLTRMPLPVKLSAVSAQSQYPMEPGADTATPAGWLLLTGERSGARLAARQGKRVSVWVDETRPRRQGASLTAWELQERVSRIPLSPIMPPLLMRRGPGGPRYCRG